MCQAAEEVGARHCRPPRTRGCWPGEGKARRRLGLSPLCSSGSRDLHFAAMLLNARHHSGGNGPLSKLGFHQSCCRYTRFRSEPSDGLRACDSRRSRVASVQSEKLQGQSLCLLSTSWCRLRPAQSGAVSRSEVKMPLKGRFPPRGTKPSARAGAEPAARNVNSVEGGPQGSTLGSD